MTIKNGKEIKDLKILKIKPELGLKKTYLKKIKRLRKK